MTTLRRGTGLARTFKKNSFCSCRGGGAVSYQTTMPKDQKLALLKAVQEDLKNGK